MCGGKTKKKKTSKRGRKFIEDNALEVVNLDI